MVYTPMDPEVTRRLLRGLDSGELKLEKPTGATSNAWKIFKVIVNAVTNVKEGKGYALCEQCRKILAFGVGGTTSSLRRHIETCSRSRSRSSTASSAASVGRQHHKMTEYVTVEPASKTLSKAQKTVLQGCVSLCCKDLRPFEITKGRGFRQLAQELVSVGADHGNIDINLLLPSPQTISRHIKTTVKEDRNKLIPFLQQMIRKGLVAATTDMWIDNYKKISYTTFTISYINEKWELKSRVLFTNNFPYDEKKTAENVLAELKRGFTNLKFNENLFPKLTFVTDQGRNIIKALSLEKLTRLNCSAHMINTILANTFKPEFLRDKAPTVISTLTATKELVASFKHTGLVCRLKNTLIQQVETRWNSRLTMLKSVHDQLVDIRKILVERDETEKMKDIDQKTMQALITFLTPFKEASDQLEGEKNVTISYVVPFYYKLLRHLQIQKEDPDYIANLKIQADAILKEKFKIDPIHKLATFLSPKFRNLKMLNRTTKEEVYADVKRLLVMEETQMELDLEVPTQIDPTLEPNIESELEIETFSEENINLAFSASTASEGSALEDADPLPSSSGASSSVLSEKSRNKETAFATFDFESDDEEDVQSDKDEFERYLELKYKPISMGENTLLWWKKHQSDFPYLASLARKTLGIPASSATSERTFSSAGFIIQERRTRLDPAVVDAILFLHNNEPVEADE